MDMLLCTILPYQALKKIDLTNHNNATHFCSRRVKITQLNARTRLPTQTQEHANPARTDNSSSGLGASRSAATLPPAAPFALDSSALPGDATSAAMRLHALWMWATRTVRSAAAPAWPMCSSSVGGDAAAMPSVAAGAASGWQTKARRRASNGGSRRRRCGGGGRFEVGGSEPRGGWWRRTRREERDDDGIVQTTVGWLVLIGQGVYSIIASMIYVCSTAYPFCKAGHGHCNKVLEFKIIFFFTA